MSDWYYENKGERGGPVSADEIRQLYAGGIISLASLVWTAAFGSDWKRLSETELAPPVIAGPPPLPPPPLPSAAPAPQPSAVIGDAFLDSELTRALIGEKPDHYLASWRSLLTKAGGDPDKVAQVSSWNWPALIFPYGWLLYRKMYVLGAVVLAFQLAYVLLPDTVSSSVSRAMGFGVLGFGILFALYGNAWYFGVVHRRWKELAKNPDQAAALDQARKTGGVNLVAPIVAFALVIAAAAAPHLNLVSWGDPAAQIRDGHMTAYPSTTVGKTLAGSFDDGAWRSFATPKGQKVVEFTGKINAALHANAVALLANSSEKVRKAGRSKAEADALELDYLIKLFQLAHRHLDGKPELGKLQQKWGCEGIARANLDGVNIAMLPNCKEYLSNFLNDAIGEWAEQAHWPVGTPVTVQWTINVTGDGFEVTHLSSKAWQGLDQDNVLDILFQ